MNMGDQSGGNMLEIDEDEEEVLAEGKVESKRQSIGPISRASYVNPAFQSELDQHVIRKRFWKRTQEASPKARTDKTSILSLFRYSTNTERFLMLIGGIAAILAGICHPIMFWQFGRMAREISIVNQVRRGANATQCEEGFPEIEDRTIVEEPDKAARASIYTFAYEHTWMAGIYAILSMIYFFCWYYAASRQIIRMRSTFFEALIRKDKNWFDIHEEHDFSAKVVDNSQRVREAIGEGLAQAIALGSAFISTTVTAILHGWLLSLLGLVVIPIIFISIRIAAVAEAKLVIKEQKAYAHAGAIAEEAISSIRTVSAYGGEKKEFHRFKTSLNESSEGIPQQIIITGLFKGLPWLSFYASYSVLLWAGAYLLLSKEICTDVESFSLKDYDIGDAIIVFFCLIYGAISLVLAYPAYDKLHVARYYANEIYHISDTKPEIDPLSNDGMYPKNKCSGEIEFENVSFSYPSQKSNTVLEGVSFKVSPGMKVGLVGLDGAGKSTILKLILKEYMVTKGTIKVDGEDINGICTRWLRSQMSLVPYDSDLFDDTIEENVKTGNPDVSIKEVIEACKKANAHGFIQRLEDGYNTRIGVRGYKLTSGERKRIAIARAILRNPKFLIMDEPTSGLDYQSESIVQEAVKKASKNRTTFIAANRLNTIVNADLVLVFQKGKLVEYGTHYSLLKAKGPYYKLALVEGTPSRPIIDEVQGEFEIGIQKNIIVHKNIKELVILTDIKNADQLLPFGQIVFNTPFDGRIRLKLIEEERDWMKTNASGKPSTILAPDGTNGLRQRGEHLGRDLKATIPLSAATSFSSDGPLRVTSSMSTTQFENDWKKYNMVREAFVKTLEAPKRIRCLLFHIIQMCSRNYVLILIGILASIGLGIVIPFYGVIFGEAVHSHLRKVSFKDTAHKTKLFSLFMVEIGLVSAAFISIQYIAFGIASYKTILFIRKRLYLSILHQDMEWFEQPHNTLSSLMKRLQLDAAKMELIIRCIYGVFINSIVVIIVRIILALHYSTQFASECILLVPFVFLFGFLDGGLEVVQNFYDQRAEEEMSRLVLDVFESRYAVSGLQLERHFISKFYLILTNNWRKSRVLIAIRSVLIGITHSSYFWAFSVCIFRGQEHILKYGLRDTLIVAEVLVIGSIMAGVNLSIFPAFLNAVFSGTRLVQILKRRPKMAIHRVGKRMDPSNIVPEIEFNNVNFTIDPKDSPQVEGLKGVSFTIKPNTIVALVGTYCSGKTSCIHLIPRFFDIDKGSIKLSGQDLRVLNLGFLRSQIGFIEEDAKLFNRTIGENIAYGDNSRKVSKGEIIEAATRANIHSFIMSLPEGYETPVGSLGAGLLTSGQRLRISIARALLRNPPILLLDSTYQGLDQESENIVQNALAKACEGRTCISVAHRLGMVRNADMILVFHQGKIVESGKFEELLERKGLFHAFYISQNPAKDVHFMKQEDEMSITPSMNILNQIEEVEKVTSEEEERQSSLLMENKKASTDSNDADVHGGEKPKEEDHRLHLLDFIPFWRRKSS